jgi:hypothetical protein
VNHILKTALLSGALMLCATLFGCGDVSPPTAPETEGEISSAIESACDSFCQNQGGSFYRATSATSESVCTQQSGQWFTADDGYTGSQPGCCCKCALLSGNCL